MRDLPELDAKDVENTTNQARSTGTCELKNEMEGSEDVKLGRK